MEDLQRTIGQMEQKLAALDAKLSNYITREDNRLDDDTKAARAYWEESVLEVAALKQEIPVGHRKQHHAWDQWIEERAWWADIRKKTVTAVIWAIILFLASRIFPGSEQFFK